MEKKNAKVLLEKYNAGLCTEEEKAIVENWYLTLPEKGDAPSHEQIQNTKNEVWKLLSVDSGRLYRFKLIRSISTAAAVIICLSTGIYFSLVFRKKTAVNLSFARHDIAPGGNRAVLILANGQKIILDDKTKGKIAEQSGVTITKTASGQLVYNISEVASIHPDTYNSIVTPRGGQYQVALPDGTRVWLNAESSLKFPAAFTGNERKVELNGEAYFEVAKIPDLPFKVVTAQQQVEVLGTHFNINCYSNELHTKTSLFEGAVKISSNSSSQTAILKPGQQSMINNSGIAVSNFDTEEALAWKNGLFILNNEELESIMRKISRWYNVDIAYQNEEVKKELFGGSISRFGNVSEILRMLEITGNVRFSIEENRIIVMKK